MISIIVVAVVALAGGGFAALWWFMREKASEEVEAAQPHPEIPPPVSAAAGASAVLNVQTPPSAAAPSALQDEIERLVARGMVEEARARLQKIAYGMVGAGIDPQEKAAFTALMKRFARIDPLYREIMALVQPAIVAQPGVLQSDLIKRLPLYDPERIRYVLYFAHELGDLYRVKKGRSYAMYPEPLTLEAGPQ